MKIYSNVAVILVINFIAALGIVFGNKWIFRTLDGLFISDIYGP